MASPVLHKVAAALLLLGCYHLALQLWSSTAPPRCRNGSSKLPASLARLRAATTSVGSSRSSSSSSSSSTDAIDGDGVEPSSSSLVAARGTWRPPPGCNLKANDAAAALLADAPPESTTLHFTFGSAGMLDFLHNWRHFVLKRGIGPVVLVGAAEKKMFRACSDEGIPALGIADGLDVWTYKHLQNVSTVVQDGKTDWDYYRHSKKSFLELGVVKAAFLWELTSLGYDVSPTASRIEIGPSLISQDLPSSPVISRDRNWTLLDRALRFLLIPSIAFHRLPSPSIAFHRLPSLWILLDQAR